MASALIYHANGPDKWIYTTLNDWVALLADQFIVAKSSAIGTFATIRYANEYEYASQSRSLLTQ